MTKLLVVAMILAVITPLLGRQPAVDVRQHAAHPAPVHESGAQP